MLILAVGLAPLVGDSLGLDVPLGALDFFLVSDLAGGELGESLLLSCKVAFGAFGVWGTEVLVEEETGIRDLLRVVENGVGEAGDSRGPFAVFLLEG
jgi:hypothetical protein